jgi:23S rRNA pseudouridine955/2504/2580 synthase
VYVDERGQKADTEIVSAQHFTKVAIDYSLLTIRLWTGRTHQIRVHCQSLGHEIGGDAKYGDREFNRQIKKLGAGRLLLHAAQLEIPQNDHTKELKIIAPQPREFELLVT